MEQQQRSMKPSMKENYPSDEVITRLFHSKDPGDNKIAAIFTIEKYKYKDAINDFLERASRDYRVKKSYNEQGLDYNTFNNKIYIFVSQNHFVQIIVGSYGLWCKSNLNPKDQKMNTIIEYI